MKIEICIIAALLVPLLVMAKLQIMLNHMYSENIESTRNTVHLVVGIPSSHGVKIESQADAIQKLEQRVKVLEDRPQTQGYFYYTPTPAWTNYPFRIPIQLDGTNIFILEGTNHVISVPCTTGAK